MTHTQTIAACCLAFSLRCEVMAKAESPAVLLERAVQAQDTKGDWDEAIVLYRQITQESDAGRPTVAEAYYRLGVCLQKKNQPQEARQAFETVVQQYSDQKDAVAKARVQLNKLAGQQAGGPIVLRTTPTAFANDVPPDLKELTVTFNQTMMDESWSWTGGGDSFPKLPGKPTYDTGRRTARLPVDLEPGKVYWVGINSPEHKFFQTPQRVPARPYVILFATRNAQGQPTPIPADLLANAKAVNEPPATSQPSTSPNSAEAAMALLDPQTREQIENFEQQFAPWFQEEAKYNAASPSERAAMIEQWEAQARGDDFKVRTRAIAALGNVACKEAVPVLMQIAHEPMGNNRPKWMAVRGLGRIGDRAAVPTLIELIDHGNTNVRVYARLGLARIAGVYLGESKDAWNNWWSKQAVKVSAADKLSSERWASKGWNLWKQQKFAEAEPQFQQATAANPGNANAWQGLGWAQMNQGQPLNAKVSFERCFALDPKNAAALNGLGWIAKGQGQIDEAIGHWKKAVEADPRATAALSGLARTMTEQQHYEEATRYYEQWLKAEPNNAEATKGLDEARSHQGER